MPLKILLAEDSPKMRQMIKSLLTANINNIDTIYECENGQQAIEIYNRHRPEWILLDIKMEPVDGLSAARIIKVKNTQAKIVFITNYDEESYREEAKKISVYAYVLKENLHELVQIYHKLFD
jgi:DNA-binding NarL/FixJ family response regulator